MLAAVRVNAVTDNWLTKEAFRTTKERERGMNHPSKRTLTRVSISLKVVKQLLVPLNKFFINSIQVAA